MTENDRRLAVVNEAKRWIGTPFVMNACVRGIGVDCGRFPHAVLTACGFCLSKLPCHWPRDFMCHRMGDVEPYLELIQQDLAEVQTPQPGDLAVFKPHRSRCFSHAAIVIGWPCIIHARGIGFHPCVEEAQAGEWPLEPPTPVRFFSPFLSDRYQASNGVRVLWAS